MIISKLYKSPKVIALLSNNDLAQQAYSEIEDSILSNHTEGRSYFAINSNAKNCNGVVPVKEKIYEKLESEYHWFREKQLSYLRNEAKKGGPIDVYKRFGPPPFFKVGLEFETGNISSAHRSMNKLCLGLSTGDLDMAVLMMPINRMSFYLTDRVSNYEELEPYFHLLDSYPFIVFGFDAEVYDQTAPLLPKGKDGMSKRALHKWKD